MMNDKDIANMVLDLAKHEVEDFTTAAMESSGNLRLTLVQIRNQCEQDQASLAQYAIQNNWYLPAKSADGNEVQSVFNFYRNNAMAPTFR